MFDFEDESTEVPSAEEFDVLATSVKELEVELNFQRKLFERSLNDFCYFWSQLTVMKRKLESLDLLGAEFDNEVRAELALTRDSMQRIIMNEKQSIELEQLQNKEIEWWLMNTYIPTPLA